MDIPLEDSSTDLLTITFGIRNFGDFEKGLREMHRVLRDSGGVSSWNFHFQKTNSLKVFTYFISDMSCLLLETLLVETKWHTHT